VPNTTLLDNHQEELAVAMERSNYVVRGHVEYVHSVPCLLHAMYLSRLTTRCAATLPLPSKSRTRSARRWLNFRPLLVESTVRQKLLLLSWTRLWASWIDVVSIHCLVFIAKSVWKTPSCSSCIFLLRYHHSIWPDLFVNVKRCKEPHVRHACWTSRT
jgi:hypothetical protein